MYPAVSIECFSCFFLRVEITHEHVATVHAHLCDKCTSLPASAVPGYIWTLYCIRKWHKRVQWGCRHLRYTPDWRYVAAAKTLLRKRYLVLIVYLRFIKEHWPITLSLLLVWLLFINLLRKAPTSASVPQSNGSVAYISTSASTSQIYLLRPRFCNQCWISRHSRNMLSKMTFSVRPKSSILSKISCTFLIFVQILLSYCWLFNLQTDKVLLISKSKIRTCIKS